MVMLKNILNITVFLNNINNLTVMYVTVCYFVSIILLSHIKTAFSYINNFLHLFPKEDYNSEINM